MNKYKFSQEEIDVVKEEYSKKKMIGSDEFCSINDKTATYVLTGRKRLEEYLNSVHPSHNMTEWYTEVKAPAGTPRFYRVRHCEDCEGEQYYHAAGRFIDPELTHRCEATIEEMNEEVKAVLT